MHCTTEVLAKREFELLLGAGIVDFHHRTYNQDNKPVAECKRRSSWWHAAKMMRSLLFRSGRQRAQAREESRQRRRRADPRSGRLGRGRAQGFRAGDGARFPESACRPASPGGAGERARHRPDRCRLDGGSAGRPEAILLPKAEGGAAVTHLDAKLTAREAIHGLPEGAINILALATETATALFLCGTYRGASPRLTGITWGAEDLSAELGAETNRDAAGRFTSPYWLARNLSLAAAAAARVQAIDTSMRISATWTGCARKPRRRGATASPPRWRSIPPRCR